MNPLSRLLRRLRRLRRHRPATIHRQLDLTRQTEVDRVRITYPGQSRPELRARVILGFQDGTELPIPETDPVVKEFVRAADRMMKPSGWFRIVKGFQFERRQHDSTVNGV